MLLTRSLGLQKVLLNSCRSIAFRQIHGSRSPLRAGHSKWANIRHIKAQKDGEKSAMFTRLSRQIRLAVQEGGSTDTTLNLQLRTLVDEALRKNMPMATIQNSIKKAQQKKTDIKKIRLEMRYKQKVYVVCITYTDNLAGLKMEIAPILKKFGVIYVDVSHMFEHFGLVEAVFDNANLQPGEKLEERATEDAIECGAEDVEITDAQTGAINFICSSYELYSFRKLIDTKGYRIENSEQVCAAKNLVQLTPDEFKAYEAFCARLRNIQGVEDIYDNVDVTNTN